MIQTELSHILTEGKFDIPNTPANALSLAVLKELNPMCMSDFEAEKVIEQLKLLGYDIIKTR